MIEHLFTADGIISLLTLTFLEIVLGIDNIIFITIAADRLPKNQQKKARNIGLLLAMGFRVALLFGISWLISLQKPFIHLDSSFFHAGISGQSLILFVGGLFLIYKATSEIHEKLEGDENHGNDNSTKSTTKLSNVILQIALINIVFSIDSILTAIGLTHNVAIMIAGVIISVLIMMLAGGRVGEFVNRHPSVQMLGLAFLIMIGFMLIAEAAHDANATFFGNHVGVIPKGYLYFAIFFSLIIEVLNMKAKRKTK
jgi:predicted tellurium resistance membrane protein TerC